MTDPESIGQTDHTFQNLGTQRRERLFFLFIVLVAYILPVVLLLLKVIPFSARFIVLLSLSVVLIAVALLRRRSWHELGFRRDTLRSSICVNLVFAIVVGTGLLLAHAFGAIRPPTINGWSNFYIFYVLISSPSQEFLFRSFVFAEMRRAGLLSAVPQVVISTVLFAFPHSIYRDSTTLLVATAMGIVWGLIYRRFPNWFGVALSHAVLGAISIAVGLI